MKPPPFEYHAPESVAETLDVLRQLGDDAKVLAGGQSLVPLLNLRLARPAHLVDINAVRELSSIDTWDGGVSLGALVRQRAAERSDLIAQRCPLLAEALPLIGHPQIRNRGTIGGSLAHADPASELPAVAAALDAQFVVRRASGQRTIDADAFFVSFFTTSIEPDELLSEVRFPGWSSNAGWSFLEVSRRHGDFAMVGVASVVRLDSSGQFADVRLAYTGMAAAPSRARDAERHLVGQSPTASVFAEAAETAVRALDPQSDVHASAAYRRHVARALTKQALAQATQRAKVGVA